MIDHFTQLKDQFFNLGVRFLKDLSTLDVHVVLLVFLAVIAVIVVDGAMLLVHRRRRESGVGEAPQPIQVEGNRVAPVRDYISEIQGLSGRPDAVVVEHGFFIPVEVKPLAKKVRDRYIAQLLVYMRLIEEFEGRRPPYGYLILGPNKRRVKVANTEAKQQWLSDLLIQMRAVLEENAITVPEPHPRKCSACTIRSFCRVWDK